MQQLFVVSTYPCCTSYFMLGTFITLPCLVHPQLARTDNRDGVFARACHPSIGWIVVVLSQMDSTANW